MKPNNTFPNETKHSKKNLLMIFHILRVWHTQRYLRHIYDILIDNCSVIKKTFPQWTIGLGAELYPMQKMRELRMLSLEQMSLSNPSPQTSGVVVKEEADRVWDPE